MSFTHYPTLTIVPPSAKTHKHTLYAISDDCTSECIRDSQRPCSIQQEAAIYYALVV